MKNILPANKNRFLWYLYDFANSLLFINITFYYSVWIVKDLALPDYWVSLPVSLSTLFLLFFLPKIGHISDRKNNKPYYLKIFTLAFIVCGIGLGLHNFGVWKLNLIVITAFNFLFYIFYQSALSTYNSLLHSVAKPEEKDAVSGLGMGVGQLGNFFGVGFAMLLLGSTYYITGGLDKGILFLYSAIICLLLIVPTFFIKERTDVKSTNENVPLKDILKTLKENKALRYYLLSYYCYVDSVLTLQIFIATYTTIALGFPESLVTTLALVSLSIITVSSLSIGKIAKKWETQNIIKYGILTWFLVFSSLAFVITETQFYIAIIANSIVFGALFALSRSYYSKLIPQSEQGKYFSIFTLFERSASIVGPLLWSATTIAGAYFMDIGDVMRLNVFVLGLMVLLGYFLFLKHLKYKTQNH